MTTAVSYPAKELARERLTATVSLTIALTSSQVALCAVFALLLISDYIHRHTELALAELGSPLRFSSILSLVPLYRLCFLPSDAVCFALMYLA